MNPKLYKHKGRFRCYGLNDKRKALSSVVWSVDPARDGVAGKRVHVPVDWRKVH